MIKLFTIEGANELLPVVESHLGALQAAVRDAGALRRAAAKLRPGSVRARNLLQEVAFVLSVAHDAKAELDRLGVEVTDLEGGRVGFPAQLHGELVSLTWRRGEDAITHYRRIDGEGERPVAEQPLERHPRAG